MSKKNSKGNNQKGKKGKNAKVLNFREFKDKCQPEGYQASPTNGTENNSMVSDEEKAWMRDRARELILKRKAEKEKEQARCKGKFDIEAIKAACDASLERRLKEQSEGSFAPVTLKEVIRKHVIEYKLELTRKRMEHGLCPHCGLSLEGVKIGKED